MTTATTLGMRDTFTATVTELLDEDPRLAVVLAEISADRLTEAAARHPERVINVGIREQLLVSVAGGLALSGMRPIAHTFSAFLVERPFEQVKLDFAHQDVGGVLVSSGGSYDIAFGGRTHMSPGDVALMDSLPGWTIQVPGHPEEAAALLRADAAREDAVYLRLSEQSNARPYATDGAMTVLKRGGEGVVLVVGPLADNVLTATEQLDVTVLYTPTVRPLDVRTLRSAVFTSSTDVLLVEPYLRGTSTHAVAEALVDIPHRIAALGVDREHELRGYGEPADHERAHGLDPASIAARARRFFHAGAPEGPVLRAG
ncbi:transketolase family protein [Sciscionella sediminilitoris]|uniref:transketolase family protein n=1 Tax=Sciscionella sediminilitoris TaxID=1445613 RepID=UPI0007C6C860|nr:transketolase [Sciscionella sp. SE31]